jgi:hypothetical protein
MANPTCESNCEALRLGLDRRLMLQFRGSVVSSDAGLLAYGFNPRAFVEPPKAESWLRPQSYSLDALGLFRRRAKWNPFERWNLSTQAIGRGLDRTKGRAHNPAMRKTECTLVSALLLTLLLSASPTATQYMGTAPAYAKPGPPSYVGRWMDNRNCRPPYENELRFSTRGMEGDELSCRFNQIRGGSGRWHVSMSCHGEGGTEQREVDLLVDGNIMQFKERGDTSKKTRCP